jgi:hypothetical protein
MLDDGKLVTKMFTKIAKKAAKAEEGIDALMTKERLIDFLGDDRFITDKLGSQVDLAEFFSDDIMKELVEHQAFDSVEGMSNVKTLLGQIDRLEQTGWSDKALKTVARSIAGIGEVPGIKQTLQGMSSAYLGEDMIPKMMYAMHLARKGWGRDAIVREVGRRLPQYRTVGAIPNSARRVVLPWITFPAEAARIMKNNMMDHPVAMTAWLQAPQIAQAALSGMYLGPQFDELPTVIQQAPPWGARYQTAAIRESAAPEVLQAFGMGTVGGLGGMAVGGARGAAIGATAGAVAGAAFGAARGKEPEDEARDFNRMWSLDFLPWSSLSLGSLHPYEWEKLDPLDRFKKEPGPPTPGQEGWQTAKDLAPVEPFAVFMPLLDLWSGRGAFGQELKARSNMEYANKMALGLLGHLMPPIIQKYGMKLQSEGGFMYPMGDIHDNNGGMQTLPDYVGTTFGGLSMGTLTFLGGRKLKGVGALGLGAATALSAATGAAAGTEINTRRFMTDMGILPDPRTREQADWTLDFLANSFFGVNKSWKASPKQSIYNQKIRDRRFAPLRQIALRELKDAISVGSESRARVALSEIRKLFTLQYADTEMGGRKFLEWADETTSKLSQLPIFSGISQERTQARRNALQAIQPELNRYQRAELAEWTAQNRMNRLDKTRTGKFVRE